MSHMRNFDRGLKYDRRHGSSSTYSSPPLSERYPASYPSTKHKDVVCIFCRAKYNIGRDWRGKCPLLLPCGHTSCSMCESSCPQRKCPICPSQLPEFKHKLPLNIYVVGLLQSINAKPPYFEDPEMSFHSPKEEAFAIQNIEQVICSNECGRIATLKCEKCDVLFCKLCFSKIHEIALKSHVAISINQNIADVLSPNVCPNHETQSSEYYCIDCDYECCSHCVIQTHKEHKTVLQKDRNEELLPELEAAYEKLVETRIRIHQTQKSLNDNRVYTETLRQSQMLENKITQHFIYLHGVLQNIEQDLKAKLLDHRNQLKRDVEQSKRELSSSEEKLKTAISVAKNAGENYDKINVKTLTEKLLELADSPCHIFKTEGYNEGFRFEIDETSIIENIQNHIQVKLPEASGFKLLKTDQLPEGYEVDPVTPLEELGLSFRSARKESPSPTVNSTASYESKSSNQSLDSSYVLEPPKVEKDNKERVKITHIIDPTNFYVQKIRNCKALKEIEELMAVYAETAVVQLKKLNINGLYIVKNPTDLKWYRGRARSLTIDPVTKNVSYEIHFIDYGMTMTNIPLEDVRESKHDYNKIPGQAIHCTLKQIAPLDDDWDEDTIDKFKQMVVGEMYIIELSVNNNLHTVELLKWNNSSYHSIHQLLLDCSLAKFVTYHQLKRMNPCSSQQFYFEDLPLEEYSTVTVLHIVSPNNIFVKKKTRYQKNKESIEKENEIKFYHDMKIIDKPVTKPEYGNPVAVFYPKSRKYERGFITEISRDGTELSVYEVDTGATVRVTFDRLKQLPGRFCVRSPQAIKIVLADIKPIDGNDWPEKVTEYLRRHLQDKKVKVIPFSKVDGLIPYYNACIVKNDTNINANLVSQNFALSTGKHSKHTALNKDIMAPKRAPKTKSKKSKEMLEDSKVTEINTEKKQKNKSFEENDAFKVRVFVDRVETPDSIYAAVCSKAEIYEKLSVEMQAWYKSNKGSMSKDLETKAYYCVYSTKDKKYCRGQFLRMSDTDPNAAKMSLIDLGVEEDVSVDLIQPLFSKFIEIPKQYFKVKLAGIKPCGNSTFWQSTTCQKLKEIIEEQGDCKYHIIVMGSIENDDDPIPVNLIITRNIVGGPTEPSRKEKLSVRSKLLEEGLALPVRDFNENASKVLAIELFKKIDGPNPVSQPLERSLFEMNLKETNNSVEISSPDDGITMSSEVEMFKDDDEFDSQNVTVSSPSPEDVSSESCPLPPKLFDWMPAAHLVEEIFHAKITHVDDDCCLYFHPDTPECEEALDSICAVLSNHYNNKSFKKYDFEWEEGELCVVQWHNDKKWYRGKVLKVDNKFKTVTVLFVDYGNQEDCTKGTLKKRIILENVPIQATRAMIAGIKPTGTTWQQGELDKIHHLLVDKTCRVKIVQQPPKPWMVAVWLIEGVTEYALPWYLKNKTNVNCNADENDSHYVDLSAVPTAGNIGFSKPRSLTTKSLNFSVNRDSSSSSKTSSSEDKELNDSSDMDSNVNTLVESEKAEKFSETLRDEGFTFELKSKLKGLDLPVNTNLLSKKFYSRSSTTSSSKSSPISSSTESLVPKLKKHDEWLSDSDAKISNFCYGSLRYDSEDISDGNKVFEKLLSGNFPSNDHDDFFDIQSVRTDYLNEENLQISSTPMNSSFQDDYLSDEQDEYPPKALYSVDFKMYNIEKFKMSFGRAQGWQGWYGHIEKTPHPELNDWVQYVYQKMFQEVQDYALEQPIFVPSSGNICIAKYTDGKWYRALVLGYICNACGEEAAKVHFIDYGNLLIIQDKNSLRASKKRWLQAPAMSFEFELANIKPAPGLEKEAKHALNDALGGSTSYYALIKEYEPKLQLELYSDEKCKNLAYASVVNCNFLVPTESK